MNLLDAQSDRLVEYVVVVGHKNKLIPYSQNYIEDVFSSAPPTRIAPEYEDETIEGPGHEVRYGINDFWGGPETDAHLPQSKRPIHPATPLDPETKTPLHTHPRHPSVPRRDALGEWPESRIQALIAERKRVQASLLEQLKSQMFEADVLDRYPQQDSKAFPFPEGLPLFCVPKGGLTVKKSPSIPFIYYFGCTMSDGGRLYGTCLAFQEELSSAQIRGLCRRMEMDDSDPYNKEVWLSHVQHPESVIKSIPKTDLDYVRDVNPNQVPLEVLQRVRQELTKTPGPGAKAADWDEYNKYTIPALWTTHCICILSHFPFLNEYRSFLTELYRLTLTPSHVPIERIVSTLVDDTPLPPPGKYRVQLNVGPWLQQYLDKQHQLSLINRCSKASKGILRLKFDKCLDFPRITGKPDLGSGALTLKEEDCDDVDDSDGDDDDDDTIYADTGDAYTVANIKTQRRIKARNELLFKDPNFVYIPTTIIPRGMKDVLTQAIQQSFSTHLKRAGEATIELRQRNNNNMLTKAANGQNRKPYNFHQHFTSPGQDNDFIPLYGMDHDVPPIDLCTIHTISKDILPQITYKQQQDLKIQILMHQQQTILAATKKDKDNDDKDDDKRTSSKTYDHHYGHGHDNNKDKDDDNDDEPPSSLQQSPTDLTFNTTHDLASHYPSADLYAYNDIYPAAQHFKPIVFSRPPPNDPLLPNSVHVFPLFWNLDLEYVITIIEALLGERKVLIMSDRLSLLAPVCEALLLLLYPFKWFHVYVPLLPKVLNAFLNAPMPYLIGTTTNMKQVIEEGGIDDHVLVYLDSNKIEYQSEPIRLPSRARHKLKERLQPFVTYVKTKLPSNHFNPKYADSAFTLSPLPDDLQEQDFESTIRNPNGNNNNTIDDGVELYSNHPAAQANGGKTTTSASSSAKQGNGQLHGELSGKLYETEYSIKHTFFRCLCSLFYQYTDYMISPVDLSTLKLGPTHLSPYPLISAKYTRVCLQPHELLKAAAQNVSARGSVMLPNRPPSIQVPTHDFNTNNQASTPMHQGPSGNIVIGTPGNGGHHRTASMTTPQLQNKGSSSSTIMSPPSPSVGNNNNNNNMITLANQQPPLPTWGEDDFMIVSLTSPGRSLTHFPNVEKSRYNKDKSTTKSSYNPMSTTTTTTTDNSITNNNTIIDDYDNDDSKALFKHEAFIKAQSKSEQPFYTAVLQSQAWSRFVDERSVAHLAHQNVTHVLFWAEQCMVKKARNGGVFAKKKATPFLDNTIDFQQRGCILVSPPLGLQRGHQHYTQYHPFMACGCHDTKSIAMSLNQPFQPCVRHDVCLECDCLHYCVSKNHERLLFNDTTQQQQQNQNQSSTNNSQLHTPTNNNNNGGMMDFSNISTRDSSLSTVGALQNPSPYATGINNNNNINNTGNNNNNINNTSNNNLNSSNNIPSNSSTSYFTSRGDGRRDTVVHRPQVAQPSLTSIFTSPSSPTAGATSAGNNNNNIINSTTTDNNNNINNNINNSGTTSLGPPQVITSTTIGLPSTALSTCSRDSISTVQTTLATSQQHCPLLHMVFHSSVPFLHKTPIKYNSFPHFTGQLFPDTIGRVPRLITVDGAQVLTFMRLQVGLLMCFGCPHQVGTTNCNNNNNSNIPTGCGGGGGSCYNTADGRPPIATTMAQLLLSPFSQLTKDTNKLKDVLHIRDTTLENTVYNPNYRLDGLNQHHVDVSTTAKASQHTFATHMQHNINNIQYIPLNTTDFNTVKTALQQVQQDPSSDLQEFKSLQLHNVTTIKLALMWTNVQTAVHKSIIKTSDFGLKNNNHFHGGLQNIQQQQQHANCAFMWLDAIAPKKHHPLALTYQCLDKAIRDPLIYSLNHYKEWVSTWHKRFTIPNSTEEFIFPHILGGSGASTGAGGIPQLGYANSGSINNNNTSMFSSSSDRNSTSAPTAPMAPPVPPAGTTGGSAIATKPTNVSLPTQTPNKGNINDLKPIRNSSFADAIAPSPALPPTTTANTPAITRPPLPPSFGADLRSAVLSPVDDEEKKPNAKTLSIIPMHPSLAKKGVLQSDQHRAFADRLATIYGGGNFAEQVTGKTALIKTEFNTASQCVPRPAQNSVLAALLHVDFLAVCFAGFNPALHRGDTNVDLSTRVNNNPFLPQWTKKVLEKQEVLNHHRAMQPPVQNGNKREKVLLIAACDLKKNITKKPIMDDDKKDENNKKDKKKDEMQLFYDFAIKQWKHYLPKVDLNIVVEPCPTSNTRALNSKHCNHTSLNTIYRGWVLKSIQDQALAGEDTISALPSSPVPSVSSTTSGPGGGNSVSARAAAFSQGATSAAGVGVTIRSNHGGSTPGGIPSFKQPTTTTTSSSTQPSSIAAPAAPAAPQPPQPPLTLLGTPGLKKDGKDKKDDDEQKKSGFFSSLFSKKDKSDKHHDKEDKDHIYPSGGGLHKSTSFAPGTLTRTTSMATILNVASSAYTIENKRYNPQELYDIKPTFAQPRGMIQIADLPSKCAFICPNCSGTFIPWLSIKNDNSSANPITQQLFQVVTKDSSIQCKEYKVPFIPPPLLLQQCTELFKTKPIQIVAFPSFRHQFNEIWWNIIWSWALLQLDMKWFLELYLYPVSR